MEPKPPQSNSEIEYRTIPPYKRITIFIDNNTACLIDNLTLERKFRDSSETVVWLIKEALTMLRLGKEKLIKKKGSLRLVLNLHCGCQPNHKFETLEAAWKHVNESGDTVTFTGALFMGFSNMKCNVLPVPNFPGLEIQFSCGDGFISSFYEKAVEHVKKTGHIIQVSGRIKKQAPARKREEVAGHPTGKVPRPSKANMAAGGAKGVLGEK
jgi:hypothetical protein